MAQAKSAADTESGKFTEAQLEDNGWIVSHRAEPRTVKAGGTGGNVELLVEEGKFIAEKTVDDHLITAVGRDMDELLEAVRSQQASIDNGIRRSTPLLLVENDRAGDADGDENVGLAGVLPETAVDREQVAANTGQTA